MLARAPKTAKHIAEAREAAKAAEVAADVVEAVASAGLHDELREVFGEEGGKEGEEGEAREEAAPRLATPVPSVPGIRRHAVRASAENAPRDAPPPAPTRRSPLSARDFTRLGRVLTNANSAATKKPFRKMKTAVRTRFSFMAATIDGVAA